VSQTERFIAWFKQAERHEKYVYYSGNSLTDSLLSVEIKKIAWTHACRGYVYLVQKKLGNGYYHFYAIKATVPILDKNRWLVPLEAARDDKASRRYTPRKPVSPEHIEVSTHG
jgi:hypothetical protein